MCTNRYKYFLTVYLTQSLTAVQLQDSLTLIIHNAWRVDFNLSLSSFEPHIHGVRNLIDLARSARYASSLRFLFTSSVGSAQSWNSKSLGPYPEYVITDPHCAVGNGYGESKYISERVCVLRPSYSHISFYCAIDPGKEWSESLVFPNWPNHRWNSEWCLGYE